MHYWSDSDEYCYPGSSVLRNIPGYTCQEELDNFEAAMTETRIGELMPCRGFSVADLRRIHRTLFQDVYDWAGQFRHVRIAKGDTLFCYPEHIAANLERLLAQLATENHLRALAPRPFAERLAWYLNELNMIHPFRDGNGRTLYLFIAMLADHAGHALDLELFLRDRPRLLNAMIEAAINDRLSALINLLADCAAC